MLVAYNKNMRRTILSNAIILLMKGLVVIKVKQFICHEIKNVFPLVYIVNMTTIDIIMFYSRRKLKFIS